jgi:WD40-like Beta Propeller Repeat
MCDADGNNVVRMTRLDGIASVPQWSPDGKKIAFELHQSGRFEIYIVDIADQVTRKLATNDLKMFAPSWSRDGKWIYFRSSESIGQRIYRCPANGGHAVALGGQPDGTFPKESVNGDVLYFATRLANTGLTALSLKAPASETAVEGFPAIAGQNLWTLGQQGVYFVPAQNPKSLNYFDFATKTNHQIFGIEKDFGGGLSISPDGHWVLYSQIEEENSDIMLVDHFR